MKIFTRKNILTVCSILIMSATTISAANMRITALGGVTAPIMRVDPLPDKTLFVPNLNVAAGALLTADFIPLLKFDTGLMYKRSVFSTVVATTPIQEWKNTFDQLFIPVTARIEVLIFSIGGGVYYSMALQDKITTKNMTTSMTSSLNYNDAGQKSSNFGIMATLGLRLKLPIIPIGFMADVWYLHGLNELSNNSSSTVSTSWKQSDIQVLVGVSLYL